MKKENIKTSEYLSTFLKFVEQVKSDYKYSYEMVGALDKSTQDILHQLELGDCKERGKFATQLTKIRKKRRQHKDYVDILAPLNRYFSEDTNWKQVEKKLSGVLGDVRKQEKYVEGQRAYRPRSLDNLTIRIIEDEEDE